MMRGGVRSLGVLGVMVVVSACSGGGSLSTAAATDPVVATPVAGKPTQATSPTSTVALPQTTAVIDSPSVSSEVSQQEVGVVVAVDGDLNEIRGFSLLLPDGAVIKLVPQAGLLFDGGPLSHLRDHLVSGAQVSVVYRVEDGVAIATNVGDAP